jgi:hypothetical protein
LINGIYRKYTLRQKAEEKHNASFYQPARNNYKTIDSNKKYEDLFNSMSEMFQVIELIYDNNGKPIDCYYLDEKALCPEYLPSN